MRNKILSVTTKKRLHVRLLKLLRNVDKKKKKKRKLLV